MNIQYFNDKSAVSLVDRRPEKWPFAMWCTISPNPCVMVETKILENGKWKNRKRSYAMLRKREQYNYCIRALRQYYYSTETRIFGVWEFNEKKHVHIHFIMTDPNIRNESFMEDFRSDIYNSELSQNNLSKRAANIKNAYVTDWMNSICKVNDNIETRIKYMTKDMNLNIDLFPYFFVNCPEIQLQGDGKVVPKEQPFSECAVPGSENCSKLKPKKIVYKKKNVRTINFDTLSNHSVTDTDSDSSF